jgi:hypothetical protein
LLFRVSCRAAIVSQSSFDRAISLPFECLFGLDRQTDCDVGAAVENLKDIVAEQATELASGL